MSGLFPSFIFQKYTFSKTIYLQQPSTDPTIRRTIMEIIKDLPEVFEEFAEQRQKSFLAVKQLKDKGIPVVGSYCTHFPLSALTKKLTFSTI